MYIILIPELLKFFLHFFQFCMKSSNLNNIKFTKSKLSKKKLNSYARKKLAEF